MQPRREGDPLAGMESRFRPEPKIDAGDIGCGRAGLF